MVLICAAMGRVTAAFLATLAMPAAGQFCEVSDLDEFDFMHSPRHGFLIYWTHPTTEVSFMVEAEGEEWTAVGFSADGDMVGSDAVIYLPDSDEVSEHILGSKSVSDITAVPGDEDELTAVEFSQSGGDTIFSFTRYTTTADPSKMTIPNAPDTPIYIIWAEGMDNGFGYHGLENRGAFLVDLFCPSAGGTDTDTDTADLETPAPSVPGTMESTMGSTPAPTATSSTSVPTPTTAPTAARSATIAPGTATPVPSVSTTAPAASPSAMPAAASAAPATPSITMPPGGFVFPETDSPVASMASPLPIAAGPTDAPLASSLGNIFGSDTPSPIAAAAAGPTDAPLASSLGITFGSDAPVAASTPSAPAATGPTIPLPAGETLAPASGARAIGDAGGTPSPVSNTAGSVAGAARVGGGVTGAAVASAVAAVCLGTVWATGL